MTLFYISKMIVLAKRLRVMMILILLDRITHRPWKTYSYLKDNLLLLLLTPMKNLSMEHTT